jgi:hypothetical protein
VSNPVEEFIGEFGAQEKTAHPLLDKMQGGLTHGLGAAVATGVMGGVGLAASHIFDAATKARDFKSMLEYNPDLAEHHERDPRMFNQMFSSLRTMNPQFSKDPLVAGTYMRRMVEGQHSGNAGGILTDAVQFRDKLPGLMSRITEEGIGAGAAHFKPRSPPRP